MQYQLHEEQKYGDLKLKVRMPQNKTKDIEEGMKGRKWEQRRGAETEKRKGYRSVVPSTCESMDSNSRISHIVIN